VRNVISENDRPDREELDEMCDQVNDLPEREDVFHGLTVQQAVDKIMSCVKIPERDEVAFREYAQYVVTGYALLQLLCLDVAEVVSWNVELGEPMFRLKQEPPTTHN
jgi:hypothetical protein